jgi:putative membrane protein
MGEFLATASVITIVLSGIALVTGVVLIRRGNREAHMRAMLTATSLAVLFLVFYLSKVAIGYTKVWVGPPGGRVWYLALLATHTIMAALNVPLALVALWYAWKGRVAAGSLARVREVPAAAALFARHRAWVRWTVPVWLYVAVTGWIIYVLLEQFGAIKG